MIASVSSATILGARGYPVSVEVHVAKGLPTFTMLGLPDESCREARDRVRAAVITSGFEWPEKKITVNLAPPIHRKTGSGLDLAIAIGVMVAVDVIPARAIDGLHLVGELALDGTVRGVPGVAPMVGVQPGADWVVPVASLNEALAVSQGLVRPIDHLKRLVEVLTGIADWPRLEPQGGADGHAHALTEHESDDLADVKGQPHARLALEVAAAGGHHLLFVGPPGAGKTMLARRLPGLLPALDQATALDTTMIHSAAGVPLPPGGLIRRPPFRAPHHTSSVGSLVGGGSYVFRPGEISLANGGVLFLDEMGQFPPAVLDGLREALETGHVMVGRVEQERVAMPARFQLIGATNPCPCGEAGVPGACQCDVRSRTRYIGKLSGPLLDRFDLRVSVSRPAVDELFDAQPGETSADVAARVARARQIAAERAGQLNCRLDEHGLMQWAPLTGAAEGLLRFELEHGRLTARGRHRVWRVARTLADLGGEPDAVDEIHVAQALAMRSRVGLAAAGRAA